MPNCDISKEEIIKCFHCGNETPMLKVGEYFWGSCEMRFSDFEFFHKYELFACPVCHKVTLQETYGDELMIDCDSQGKAKYYETKNILFPLNNMDSNSVPQKIKEAYEAALKTKGIDKYVCLLALRRTLELMLKDKGAVKWGLEKKIEEIAAKGLLPDVLQKASAGTKLLGDTAAHDKELQIDQYDVETMAEFIGFIIDYLYIIPDKISTYKKRIDKKINSKN